jgi:hypothetical protein
MPRTGTRAVAELAEELAEFSYDGLTLLHSPPGRGAGSAW